MKSVYLARARAAAVGVGGARNGVDPGAEVRISFPDRGVRSPRCGQRRCFVAGLVGRRRAHEEVEASAVAEAAAPATGRAGPDPSRWWLQRPAGLPDR